MKQLLFAIWIALFFCFAVIGETAAPLDVPVLSDVAETPAPEAIETPLPRSYLFIHDTSTNMRRRQRISIMQESIRSVLNALSPDIAAGLRAFGHRFPVDGPDVCDDTDIIIPVTRLTTNRDDFENHLNTLADAVIGGGSPVGLALKQGMADLEYVAGAKEIFVYTVDPLKCADTNVLTTIQSACQVADLHLTLIGFGLKTDLQVLQDYRIPRLSCVDILNVNTPEDVDALPDQLLTRLSVEFRNADGRLVDPASGERLSYQLTQRARDGTLQPVREKTKDPDMKGAFIDTVGLREGTYLLDLTYQGQKLRQQREVFVANRQTLREIIRLGRLDVAVTDSQGQLLTDPQARKVTITISDAGKVIRNVSDVAQATFDLLPSSKYTVQIAYEVDGKLQMAASERTLTIREGNHQQLTIPLPLGTLKGNIVDVQGRPAEQVEVLLLDRSTPESSKKTFKKTLSDTSGNYIFPDVPARPYAVQFKRTGYKVETIETPVIGGHVTQLDDVQLFHGIEVIVTAASGLPVEEANVNVVHKETSVRTSLSPYRRTYRNSSDLPDGTYLVTVEKSGYVAATENVTFQTTDAAVEATVTLPYYVTVQGKLVNGKDEPLPEAVITSRQRYTQQLSQDTADQSVPALSQADGSFHVKLVVNAPGDEELTLHWRDQYNQSYLKTLTVTLPQTPQTVNVETLRMPINFFRLTLRDVLGDGLTADQIILSHAQTGQTGFALTQTANGVYQSPALPDGDYQLQVLKEGYQEAQRQFSVSGGTFVELSATLPNYVTIMGIVLDGQQRRVSGATVHIDATASTLTSGQPIVTGKDGRFQTTLLVTQAAQENLSIVWKSPETGKKYQLQAIFALPGIPIAEFYPMLIGNFQLPINRLRVDVRDVAGKGLRQAQVQFISAQGESIPAREIGDGLYESPDLPDETYDIAIAKTGYKEYFVLPDLVVGPEKRDIRVEPVVLPHYATISGRILNGLEQGLPNVMMEFGGRHSEQLAPCSTDAHGHFTTTVLVHEIAEEAWKARWKKEEYSASGNVDLPAYPDATVNLGDIYLPINFVSLPIQDIYGAPLSRVTVDVTYIEGAPIKLDEFLVEEIETGVYQAQNLPDGVYTVMLEKEGFESGKGIDITIKGGKYEFLEPVVLGHYVTLQGTALDGKGAAAAGVHVRVQELTSTLILPDGKRAAMGEEIGSPDLTLTTDEQGVFTAKLLVRKPGVEQLLIAWGERYSSLHAVQLNTTPGPQPVQVLLPMNFVQAAVLDIAGCPIPEVSVTLTHQIEKVIFPTTEIAPGIYESPAIPDGNYILTLNKERYASYTAPVTVQGGEVKQTQYRLNHYVTIKGRIMNGKREKVAAATIQFDHLKTSLAEKTLSSPDGAFEVNLLVQEQGREAGHVTWVGAYGTHAKDFWIDLPAQPATIMLPEADGLLPINFISLELKSVAATGVPGATVTLTHHATGQVIAARDLDHGNYEGQELPDGAYDIAISKAGYQSLTIDQVTVEQGEHKIGLAAPRFLHFMTISGVVLNGKVAGVADARIMMEEPKRVQAVEPVTTRSDGSFTLQILVTDVGTETLNVRLNGDYAITVPVPLPTVPKQIQLDPITLPMNFIIVNVQSIAGEPIPDMDITFLKNPWDAENLPELIANGQNNAVFQGQEMTPGRYESPDLPDGKYLVVARKEGYLQDTYATVAVQAGVTVSNVTITVPHLVTVKGVVQNGKQQGISGAVIRFGGQFVRQSRTTIFTDQDGGFREQVLVTGTGKETITVTTTNLPSLTSPGEQFTLTQEFELHTIPGDQEFGALRLPMNAIPIEITDVAGQAIADAEVTLIRQTPGEDQPRNDRSGNQALYVASASAQLLPDGSVNSLREGHYEGFPIPDGRYTVQVTKVGYESQEREIQVTGGEVAPATVFTLPHYITINGLVTNGNGDGVPEARLEFDPAHALLIRDDMLASSDQTNELKTDIRGYFWGKLLVKNIGEQRVRISWQERYRKELVFPLPAEPMHAPIEEEIRLPINFAPLRVINVLGEGLAGVNITLKNTEGKTDDPGQFRTSGNGMYEAQQLSDGMYTMTISKAGYQEQRGQMTLQGGERLSEQLVTLPHFVSVRGKVVNGKGIGVAGAKVILAGLNSQFVSPNAMLLTQANGDFQLELVVTGKGPADLQEQIAIQWDAQPQPFEITRQFTLPVLPGYKNLGILTLPANFVGVSVLDAAGKGLAGVTVQFVDAQGNLFAAQEISAGFYEGQNLPDGIYAVKISKTGYQEASQENVVIGAGSDAAAPRTRLEQLSYRLPYYITLQGSAVDGKGQVLRTGVSLELQGSHSRLLPDSVVFTPDGKFEARLMVYAPGKDYLRLAYAGEHGQHARQVEFLLPQEPAVLDVQRVVMPVNYIPIEVNDLRGYGLTAATVTLQHQESGKKIAAKDLGNGRYEGESLPDGTYTVQVAKEGYKAVESPAFTVADGIVSEPKIFVLQHYVWITGTIINGEGAGVRDPILTLERLRSQERQKFSDSNGKFEVELEVQEIGNERLYIEWKNMYRTPFLFKLPVVPEQRNVGEIRLPINFLSILVTDISGSTLPGADVTIATTTGVAHTVKTDSNGFCKTPDLPNGLYTIVVEKSGYKRETREVYVSDGNVVPVRFTLPHYVVVAGRVKDIRQKAVGGVAVIFEEFLDAEGQSLRTSTDPLTGEFQQNLLITDPAFLERQRAHFRLKKGTVEQVFTFKVPAEPNQVAYYKTLLFPTNYLLGKVVDADLKTAPIADAAVSLVTITEHALIGVTPGNLLVNQGSPESAKTFRLITDELGQFELGDLPEGEYKITIQKEGYRLYEDFIRISGLLQEKEFPVRKESK